MAKRRVLFINSETKTVTETVVETLKDMQFLVGGLIERAHIFENGDELYVNEEGLFQNPNNFFLIRGPFANPLAGNAYVIGSVTETGNNRDVKSTASEMEKQIAFLGQLEQS